MAGWGVGVDASHVYWPSYMSKKIYRVPKSGGAPEELVSTASDDVLEVVVSDCCVYWSEPGGTYRVAK
jgi:hypothetical protein